MLSYFNETPIDQIKLGHVEQFKLWRIKQKKSAPAKKVKKSGTAIKTDNALKPATVNRELARFKMMLNYFIKSESKAI